MEALVFAIPGAHAELGNYHYVPSGTGARQPTRRIQTISRRGAAQRPPPGEDHLMAVTINSLNEDRSRLAWRVRQAGVPSEIIDELINDNIVARYARRFRLFLQGAPGDVLMIIINGVVKVHCAQPDGRRFLVELAGPGDIIGYVDRVDAKGRHCQAFEAQALTNCAVALISRQRILKLLGDSDHATLISLFERLNTFWGS